MTRFAVALLTLALLAAPVAAEAQKPSKMPRIGYLESGVATPGAPLFEAFRQGLRELGWLENQNMVLDVRFAEGKYERLRELAADLVRLRVEVIVTFSTPAAVAAKQATTTIPIVIGRVADPVGRAYFPTLTRNRAEALIVFPDGLFLAHGDMIIRLAAQARLPTMYGVTELTKAGGLMGYGVNLPDMYRRGATYVDKILKGAKPADLPVEQPTKFELVVNLKTAKALGLTIPPSVLARAEEIIE